MAGSKKVAQMFAAGVMLCAMSVASLGVGASNGESFSPKRVTVAGSLTVTVEGFGCNWASGSVVRNSSQYWWYCGAGLRLRNSGSKVLQFVAADELFKDSKSRTFHGRFAQERSVNYRSIVLAPTQSKSVLLYFLLPRKDYPRSLVLRLNGVNTVSIVHLRM